MDPRNTHERKFWTHEIPTRKNLEPTQYPRENILEPRNTHEKNFRSHEGTMEQSHETHETHDGSRQTEFSTLFFEKQLVDGLVYYNAVIQDVIIVF